MDASDWWILLRKCLHKAGRARSALSRKKGTRTGGMGRMHPRAMRLGPSVGSSWVCSSRVARMVASKVYGRFWVSLEASNGWDGNNGWDGIRWQWFANESKSGTGGGVATFGHTQRWEKYG